MQQAPDGRNKQQFVVPSQNSRFITPDVYVHGRTTVKKKIIDLPLPTDEMTCHKLFD